MGSSHSNIIHKHIHNDNLPHISGLNSISVYLITAHIFHNLYSSFCLLCRVGPDIEVQSKLYSDIYNPDYDFRLEFREPVFPISSMLVVKVGARYNNKLITLMAIDR